MKMGNNNVKHGQVIHDLDLKKTQNNMQSLNYLQAELEELKGIETGENDMYQVFVSNISN